MKNKLVTSKDNPIFKNAVKLLRKKYRDETGTYLLEGIKPLENAINQGIEIQRIFVRESDSDGGIDTGRDFLVKCDNIIVLSDNLFKQLSDTETSQGIIAVVSKKYQEAEGSSEHIESFKYAEVMSTFDPDDGRSIVILDKLQDPGNIGTIIRTAEAAGFALVIAVKGTTDVYAPKVVRAAAGSLFRIDIITGVETDEVISFCKNNNRQIIVTTLDAGGSCFQSDLTHSAIVIGNEGNGVCSEFVTEADKKVKIPMKGEIESLNAAVAASVLMFECARQEAAGKVK